ncbi:50S ribosome-binding GTPase [Corynebacterium sp. MSK041]|uniref:dynamin family protein n=1 Tax=Corynebacterium sp. MSK041 TaxID=3050194 RepID=UPI00254BE68E|nr:dynamin family protein [Corynebacterium sp. MSK041]MDK8795252.1 50S ribosome-binding GTPase [Corynebacterium sp. MSK041]
MASILDLLLAELQGLSAQSPELAQACAPLTARVSTPPRIVIVGRIKAGKSTLLNALVGAPVAETKALEATNVVTVYQYGAPDRAEAMLRNGQRVPIQTMRGEVAALPAPPVDIAFIDRWMPASAVSNYTLIDTPGLATLTDENEATTRAALIDGYEQTRSASVDADAAMFLFDSAPRRDEVEFIQQLGFTPLNTMGVLSRADSFGEGPLGQEDPMVAAGDHAQKLQRELASYVGRVMPVSGLLAQTAATGVVTESLTRQIARVTAMSRTELITELFTAEPGGSRSAINQITNVIDVVGEYGLFLGAEEAAKGAATFNEWLTQSSGIGAVRDVLEKELSTYAYLHRAGEILASMETLVYRHPTHSDAIRQAVSTVRNHPAALPAKLLVTLKGLLTSSAQNIFVEEATRLAAIGSPAQRLGLPDDANPWQILDRIQEKRREMQTLSFGLLDPSEEHALVTFAQAYDQLERNAQAMT